MENGFPLHTIPEKDKTPDKYFKPVADYYINQVSVYNTYRTQIQTLYDTAEGLVDSKSYKYVLNPTNTKNESLTRFPAVLRNYDILSPVIEMFMGEGIPRNEDPPIVTFVGQDTEYAKRRLELIRRLHAQTFVNELNNSGFETGVESEEVPDVKDALKDFDSKYGAERAMLGQQALLYLMSNLQVDEVLQAALYDWLVVGYIITLKEVVGDDVVYTVCDPRDVNVIGLPVNGFIEDAEAVVLKRKWTRTEIIKNLELNKEEVIELESKKNLSTSDNFVQMTTEDIDRTVDMAGIASDVDVRYDVYYVVWQGVKLQKILTYNDPITGAILKKEVSEDYKLSKKDGDISLESVPTNCWYETYRIGQTMYKVMQEGLVQRNMLNNVAENKLPFNGRMRGYRNKNINSIVKIGLAYQTLYNIVHYRFEFMLAKSKDKLTTFPIGLIPKKYGWSEDKWFYWAMTNSVAFFDESAPGAAIALQGIKQIDLSLSQYIGQMWEILRAIKDEWWDTIGMNRNRYGDTRASEGKATNEQSIARSAIITEDMFRQLDEVFERDYQGLLDFAKVAWINGKQGYYITSDKQRAFFSIEGTEFAEASYAVFAKNSRKERDKLDEAKNLLLTLGQNGVGSDSLLGILDAANMETMKDIAAKAVASQRQYEQAIAKQQQDALAQSDQMKAEITKMESADKRYVADRQYQAVVDSARIRAEMDLTTMMAELGSIDNTDDTEILDRLGAVKENLHREMVEKELGTKAEAANLKREQMANSLAIAKTNKNKYDE